MTVDKLNDAFKHTQTFNHWSQISRSFGGNINSAKYFSGYWYVLYILQLLFLEKSASLMFRIGRPNRAKEQIPPL